MNDTTDIRRHLHALPNGYRLHWYEIDDILGLGGFGITYLAHDVNLKQRVAIKEFLPTDLAGRGNDHNIEPVSRAQEADYKMGLARFIREAQTLARFKHPNIVDVNAVFQENNTAYLVMEYVEGEVLEDAVRARRVKSEERLLEILHALLDGLELIHDAGYIHRDIKPDNIYLRSDGSPVLLDFGSARQASGPRAETMTALVSPGYAPYEQYDSSSDLDTQGPWTDIYALGASFYRAVTGRGPVEAIVRMHSVLEGRDRLRPAVEIGKGWYSQQFLRAIDSALEFRPADRPQSVSEWRELLPQRPGSEGDEDDSGLDLLLIAEEAAAEPDEEETVVLQAPLVGDEDEEDEEETVILTGPVVEPGGEDAEARAAPVDVGTEDEEDEGNEDETVVLTGPVVGEDEGQQAAQESGVDQSELETAIFDTPPETDAGAGDNASSVSSAEEFDEEAAIATVIGESVAESDTQHELETVIGPLADTPASEPAKPAVPPATSTGPSRVPQLVGVAVVALMLMGGLWWYWQQERQSRVPTQTLTVEQRIAIESQRRATAQRLEEQQAATAQAEREAAEAAELQRQQEEAARVAEQQRLAQEQEAARLAEAQRLAEEQEAARLAEQQRLAQEQEAARIAEEQRLAREQEAARLAEAQRLAEEQEAARLAEAQRLAEEQEAARLAEAQRVAEEQAAAQLAEALRLAEEQEAARLAEAQRLAEEQEAARLAEEQRLAMVQTPDTIADLLARADADIANQRLTSPAGNNAVERLGEVLELDPDNAEVEARYKRIVDEYVSLAHGAAEAGEMTRAEGYLDKAQTVYADAPQIAAAREAIALLEPPESAVTPAAAPLGRCEPKLLDPRPGAFAGVPQVLYQHPSFSAMPAPKVRWAEYQASSRINNKATESSVSRYEMVDMDGVSARVRKRHRTEFDNGAGTASFEETANGEHIQVLGGLVSPVDELRSSRETVITRNGQSQTTQADTVTRTRLTRMYDITGRLFPLSSGNRFSYKGDSQVTDSAGAVQTRPHEGKPYSYQVGKTVPGRDINPNLQCDVYVVDYSVERNNYRDSGKLYFSVELGLIARQVGESVRQLSDGRSVSRRYERNIVDFALAD